MTKQRQYTLNVKVTVTPMEYLRTSSGHSVLFDQAVSKALRQGTEALRDSAGRVGLTVLDSTHYYEDGVSA